MRSWNTKELCSFLYIFLNAILQNSSAFVKGQRSPKYSSFIKLFNIWSDMDSKERGECIEKLAWK